MFRVMKMPSLLHDNYQPQKPLTVTEFALNEIKKLIIFGGLNFGEKLSEQFLVGVLGIKSKTPIREAFLKLQNEGLVTIVPQSGTYVFALSKEDLNNLKELRIALEATALTSACRKNAERLIGLSEDNLRSMREEIRKEDFMNGRYLDSKFHENIIELAGNSYLSDAYRLIKTKVDVLRYRTLERDSVVESYEAHQRLLDFIRKGNEGAAITSLTEHISVSVDFFLRII